jgi:hypothetical protein
MARRPSNRRALDTRWGEMVRHDTLGRPILYAVPIVGARFGSLVVVDGDDTHAFVRCDCQDAEWTPIRSLLRGKDCCRACATQRAGAKRASSKAHAGIFPTPALLSAWAHRYSGIVSRCTDPGHKAWPNYGGRGILLHPEWREDRLAFYEYAKTLDGWDQSGLDLDRIDNNRGYEPGNLRLVTRAENANNRRGNVLYNVAGESIPYREFCERFCPKWSFNTARWHFDKGRSAEWIVAHYRKTREGL